jgi:hypothetical protein
MRDGGLAGSMSAERSHRHKAAMCRLRLGPLTVRARAADVRQGAIAWYAGRRRINQRDIASSRSAIPWCTIGVIWSGRMLAIAGKLSVGSVIASNASRMACRVLVTV